MWLLVWQMCSSCCPLSAAFGAFPSSLRHTACCWGGVASCSTSPALPAAILALVSLGLAEGQQTKLCSGKCIQSELCSYETTTPNKSASCICLYLAFKNKTRLGKNDTDWRSMQVGVKGSVLLMTLITGLSVSDCNEIMTGEYKVANSIVCVKRQ